MHSTKVFNIAAKINVDLEMVKILWDALYHCSWVDENTGEIPIAILPGEQEICLGILPFFLG